MKLLSKYLLLGIVFVVVSDIVDLFIMFFPEQSLIGGIGVSASLVGLGVGLLALWWEDKKAWHIPVLILYGALVLLITFYSFMLTHGLLGLPFK